MLAGTALVFSVIALMGIAISVVTIVAIAHGLKKQDDRMDKIDRELAHVRNEHNLVISNTSKKLAEFKHHLDLAVEFVKGTREHVQKKTH